MNWVDDARALDQRIRGLVEAGNFFIGTLAVNSEDPYAVCDRYLSAEARRIFEEVVAFHERYAGVLPSAASDAIGRFVSSATRLMTGGDVTKLEGLKARLALLAVFRAELAYHLSDQAAVARRLSERAFQHLQRRIVADPTEHARWAEAFKQGETACEKLGAAHLLWHGLWGFKVSGAGEATDLIFGEPIDVTAVQSAAEALVLTEWKLVRQPSQATSQAQQAHAQASRYARGVLGGLELRDYRYLVIVSEDFVDLPEDFTEDDVRYRHVNIAVSPKSPSKS
jgi:hypothetical protein